VLNPIGETRQITQHTNTQQLTCLSEGRMLSWQPATARRSHATETHCTTLNCLKGLASALSHSLQHHPRHSDIIQCPQLTLSRAEPFITQLSHIHAQTLSHLTAWTDSVG